MNTDYVIIMKKLDEQCASDYSHTPQIVYFLSTNSATSNTAVQFLLVFNKYILHE